jgi:peroxiredoxin
MRFLAALLLAIATIAPSPPKIGQQAPGFTLRDQHRRRVSLAEGTGTKVVVFYRGYW